MKEDIGMVLRLGALSPSPNRIATFVGLQLLSAPRENSLEAQAATSVEQELF